MSQAKRDNYEQIYKQENVARVLDESVKPMMQKMYYQLLDDLKKGKKSSPIYQHHVDFVLANHYASSKPYMETEPNQIVVDYIASMTDDYCTELYNYMFPDKPSISIITAILRICNRRRNIYLMTHKTHTA